MISVLHNACLSFTFKLDLSAFRIGVFRLILDTYLKLKLPGLQGFTSDVWDEVVGRSIWMASVSDVPMNSSASILDTFFS